MDRIIFSNTFIKNDEKILLGGKLTKKIYKIQYQNGKNIGQIIILEKNIDNK